MSEGINTVLLQGELVNPELKYVSNGAPLYKAKLKMSIEDNRSGDLKESYLRITAWNEFAEYLNSLPVGSKVRLSAVIQDRSYVDKSGQKKYTTELVVNGVELTDESGVSNSFMLQGDLLYPELKLVGGDKQTPLFKAKVKVPVPGKNGLRNSYVRITAWDEVAEGLNNLSESSIVRLSGHVQERDWVDPRTNQTRVFTDAVVTNYVVVS